MAGFSNAGWPGRAALWQVLFPAAKQVGDSVSKPEQAGAAGALPAVSGRARAALEGALESPRSALLRSASSPRSRRAGGGFELGNSLSKWARALPSRHS